MSPRAASPLPLAQRPARPVTPASQIAARVRMFAKVLALVRAGHLEAAIGALRALASRFPESEAAANDQIEAIELLLAEEPIPRNDDGATG